MSLRYPGYPEGPGSLISGTPDTPIPDLDSWYSLILPDIPDSTQAQFLSRPGRWASAAPASAGIASVTSDPGRGISESQGGRVKRADADDGQHPSRDVPGIDGPPAQLQSCKHQSDE
jgi:hypothetical protein